MTADSIVASLGQYMGFADWSGRKGHFTEIINWIGYDFQTGLKIGSPPDFSLE